jgi:2-keto-4-pentenoate hydratase/2-oxohepta-3-ene-1,7-dioic acid hydratase in catechol pathway
VDEIKDWSAVTFEFAVNDEVRQKGDTSLLIF